DDASASSRAVLHMRGISMRWNGSDQKERPVVEAPEEQRHQRGDPQHHAITDPPRRGCTGAIRTAHGCRPPSVDHVKTDGECDNGDRGEEWPERLEGARQASTDSEGYEENRADAAERGPEPAQHGEQRRTQADRGASTHLHS